MENSKVTLNKVHIIGSIGSGKTTLAKKLSDQFNIPFYELDNVVWKRSDTGDIKRTESERNSYLNKIVTSKNWIIEGVHHKWVSQSFHKADVILFLDIRISTRRVRIVKRFLKQKMGIEPANYNPTFKLLKFLYSYNSIFEYESKPEIFSMLKPYMNKVIIIKDKQDVINILDEYISDS